MRLANLLSLKTTEKCQQKLVARCICPEFRLQSPDWEIIFNICLHPKRISSWITRLKKIDSCVFSVPTQLPVPNRTNCWKFQFPVAPSHLGGASFLEQNGNLYSFFSCCIYSRRASPLFQWTCPGSNITSIAVGLTIKLTSSCTSD